MATTVSYEQHVQQNNERLISIRQALQDSTSFCSAAKELLEWVADIRAFQKPFEQNLVSCLGVVSELAKQEGFDLELGYRLLSNCFNRRDRLSPENAALLEQWNEELGQALLHRHNPKSQIVDSAAIMQKNGPSIPVPQHQQQMMWADNPGVPSGGGSVSVVTTVYPGSVTGNYGGPAMPQATYDPNSVTGNYVHAAAPMGPQKGSGYGPMGGGVPHHPGNGNMVYNRSAVPVSQAQHGGIPYNQPGYMGPRGSSGGPQYAPTPGPPGRAAMTAAKVAAAAVATATATAVAYENSQQIQSHQQYDGQQMPMSYAPNGSQVYGQPHPGQMMQQPVGHGAMVPGQAGYPSGRVRMPSQMGGYHPSHMGQMPMGPHRGGPVPAGAPPQYPGHPVARMRNSQPGVPVGPRMVPGGSYPVRGQVQRVLRPGVYPQPGVMTPNGYMQHSMMRQGYTPVSGAPVHPVSVASYPGAPPNGMVAPVSSSGFPPAYHSQQSLQPQHLVDIKPVINKPEEERIAFAEPDGKLLNIFRLEHNLNVTQLEFFIKDDVYQTLMQNPDADVQLKCFHHDDRNLCNNWPHDQQSSFPSVDVAVNGHPVRIDDNRKPLYIKRFCQPAKNTLQITVRQCCCSHFFLLQRVSRPTLATVVRKLVSRSGNNIPKSYERIKRHFSQNTRQGVNGSVDIEQMSECVSLLCPIGMNLMEVPARGGDCAHIQCFDLRNFLLINEEKATWQCPICQKQVMYESIETDAYFGDIIGKLRGNPSIDKVTVFATGRWEPVGINPPLKTEPPGSHADCPAPKRFKSEPGVGNNSCPSNYWNEIQHPASVGAVTGLGSPQQINNGSVLSPYAPGGYSQASPAPGAPASLPQRSPRPAMATQGGGPATPGHAGRGAYGPPTPVTPSTSQNPPSVGTYATGPRSVEPSGQPNIQQQTSTDGSVGSIAGSAPYTPASVGSAGSHQGSGNGQSLQTQQSGSGASSSEQSTDFDFGCDLFGDSQCNDNMGQMEDAQNVKSSTESTESKTLAEHLLSDSELLQYLDTTDFSSNNDFGVSSGGGGGQIQPTAGQSGTGSSTGNGPPPFVASNEPDDDNLLASFGL